MIGRNLHIADSCFRLLPNPTLYRWDRKNFSLSKMLASYDGLVRERGVLVNQHSVVITRIKDHIVKLQDELDLLPPKTERNGWLSLPLIKVLHNALEDLDEVLTAKKRKPRLIPASPPPTNRTATLRSNHERHGSQNKLLDAHLQKQSPKEPPKEPLETEREAARRQMVQDVLRSHLQEVLHMINERSPDSEPPSATGTNLFVMAPPRFEDIDAAAPEDKQAKFMEVYFKVVRRNVVRQSASSTQRRLSIAPSITQSPIIGIKRQGTATTHSSIAEREGEDRAKDLTANEKQDPGGEIVGTEKITSPPPQSLWDLEDVSHEDIWCGLVFRMMCWLMLHDFHKKDVQVSKSELLGSRLPVYIA
jgi:hypothetical protein